MTKLLCCVLNPYAGCYVCKKIACKETYDDDNVLAMELTCLKDKRHSWVYVEYMNMFGGDE
jgi:hypothetical protein